MPTFMPTFTRFVDVYAEVNSFSYDSTRFVRILTMVSFNFQNLARVEYGINVVTEMDRNRIIRKEKRREKGVRWESVE